MHCLVIGRTLSGKTTFTEKKTKSINRLHGRKIIVLDPMLDKRWGEGIAPSDIFVTSNKQKFLQMVWNSKNCVVVVDEAGKMIGKYDDVMDELATTGRHFGHKCFFITQRAKQISTTIRTQCSEIAIFKQSKDDTKDLANEFVEPMINEAHTLAKGEFIYVRDGQAPEKLNVFEL